jgi:hypothetical protein
MSGHTAKSHKKQGTPFNAQALERTLPSDQPGETWDTEAGVDTGIPEEKPAEQQPWYRPPDSKARTKANQIAILTAAGHDDRAIAKKLKTTDASIRQYRYLAKKNGWVNDDGEPVDIEAEFAHSIDRKVVRNISASLDGRMMNHQQFDMTLAAAKGRGHFKNHTDAKQEQVGGMNVVAINVVMPVVGSEDQKQLTDIPESQVGGQPAYLEGEVT